MEEVRACITGVGGYVPDYVLTNAELETMVDTNDEWILTRTGIKERRILKEKGKGSSFMGIRAAEDLLAKKNIDPLDIDMVICATVTADTPFPDNANTIATAIGAKRAWGFDINAACSGFLYAVSTAAKFIVSGSYKKVLVIGTDKMSSIVDYEDRTTCIIFGDGAGAVLLEPSSEGHGIMDESMHGDGEGRQYLYMKAGGSIKPPSKETVTNKEHFIVQNGRPVFKAAVAGMVSSTKEVLARQNLQTSDIQWIAPHQANIRILRAVSEGLDVPMDRVMTNIEKYGNTTAGTIPLCLWEFEQKLKKGDNLLLTAFGGGFTWGTIYLTWAYSA